MKLKKLWSASLAVMVSGLMILSSATIISAQTYSPISPTLLKQEIDEFAAAGASGYLVWQYSGDRGTGQEFENDKYSFFRNSDTGPAMCETLKTAAADHPNMFIGVNVWSAGDAKNSSQKLEDHFNYLKNDCGVSVVRIFAKAGGGAGTRKVADAAAAAGIKVIVALGDYSNGGGGVPQGAGKTWYESGYQGSYLDFVNEVTSAVGANHPGLYGYELANEPHCGGDASALDAYTNWVSDMAGKLGGQAPNLGIGQMASQNTTQCDSPGPNHYAQTNAVSGITMGSAHYYSDEEKTNAKAALAQLPAGKLFYIGEASWGGRLEEIPDNYYLYPINGLQEGNRDQIVRSLAQQGYEVQCTTPKFSINAIQSGDITSFLRVFPSPVLRWEPDLLIDYADSQIPLFRGSLNNSVTDSLETYFGFRNTTETDELRRQIASAPLYSLLTPEQQCQKQVSILQTINNMCQQLDDPTTCALYQAIPGTNYDTQTLYLEWQNATTRGLSCSALADGWQSSDGVDEAKFKAIRIGLDHTPLYLDKAYRLAFLVIATELKPDEGDNFFSFLTPQNQTASPKHEVKVVAFKIPDVGTNKAQGDLNYSDPLQITRDIYQDYDQQLKKEVEAAEKRQQLISGGNTSLVPPIECGGSESCNDPLVGALVDMIGKNGLSCESNPQDLPAETANQIQTSGNISSNPGRIFKTGFDLVKNLFTQPPAAQENPQQAEFNFLSIMRPQQPVKGSDYTEVKSFLVYPVGTELRSVENTLIGRFYGYDAIERFENNPPENLKPYFKLNGVTQNFANSTEERRYIDPQKIANSDCELDGDLTDCQNEIRLEVKADTIDTEPRILGGKLGFVIRSIQEAITGFETKANEYVTSCRTTEDFLLGRCEGGTGGPAPEVGASCTISGGIIKNPANPAEWIGGEMIQSQLLKNLVANAAQKYNVPVQVLMATLWMENCRGAANICGMSDAEIRPYIESQTEYSPNCPGGGADSQPFTGQAKGVFAFYHNLCLDTNGNGRCDAGERAIDWGYWRESAGDNVCNIKDSAYAAARYLSYNYNRSFNSAPPASQWSLPDAERVLTRWAANVEKCDDHPFARDYCRLIGRLWSGDAKVTTTCN